MNTALHGSIKFFESGKQESRNYDSGSGELRVGRVRSPNAPIQRTARRSVPTQSGTEANNCCVLALKLSRCPRFFAATSRLYLLSRKSLSSIPDFLIQIILGFLVSRF